MAGGGGEGWNVRGGGRVRKGAEVREGKGGPASERTKIEGACVETEIEKSLKGLSWGPSQPRTGPRRRPGDGPPPPPGRLSGSPTPRDTGRTGWPWVGLESDSTPSRRQHSLLPKAGQEGGAARGPTGAAVPCGYHLWPPPRVLLLPAAHAEPPPDLWLLRAHCQVPRSPTGTWPPSPQGTPDSGRKP